MGRHVETVDDLFTDTGELRLAEENGTLPEDMDVDADEEDDRESDDGE